MISASLRQDLLLRAAGTLILAGAVACLAHLFHDPAAAHGAGGWREALEAAFGFLGCSTGAVLTLLGRHIYDQVAVSNRWAKVGRNA